MMTFDNKLELRYYFNDKSDYMDTLIHHRCEKEVLSLLRMLADMLDVKMTVYNGWVDRQDGFRDVWSVAGGNSRLISIVLNLFMQVWTRPTLLMGGQPVRSHTAVDEEKMQREVALLRNALKRKQLGLTLSRELVELLAASPRVCKCKSNFYEALRGYPKVTRLTLRELNGNNRSRSGSLEVRREQFDFYILRSDELPPVKDAKATIEIISPVLKDSRLRWKGIYNKGGETIDFYMNDEAFKRDMLDEKITFKSGICIDCVLEIQRRLNELGETVNVGYTVETVIRTRFDKLEIVTPQGKRHLQKLEAEKRQLTLDLFG